MASGSIILLKNQKIKIVNNERFILSRKKEVFSGALRILDAEKIPMLIIKKLIGFSSESEKEFFIGLFENLKRINNFFKIIFFIIRLKKRKNNNDKVDSERLRRFKSRICISFKNCTSSYITSNISIRNYSI